MSAALSGGLTPEGPGPTGKLAAMLPKSRIFSSLLLGLGVALLVAGLVAPRFFHADGRLPLDLGATTWTLQDPEAQTRLNADGRVVEAPVSRQLHLEVQEPANDEEATVRIGETLMRESRQDELDRLISAAVWNYRIDRVTGEPTSPATLTDQLAAPAAEVEVDGYWLKFPTHAEQTSYDVFDPLLRESRPAVFGEGLEMDGRTVYRYRQEIEPTNVAQLYAGLGNTMVLSEADGSTTQGYLFHAATRDIFVDQVSGMVVDIRESVDDFYGTADGEKREQVLAFDGGMPREQVDVLLDQASTISDVTISQTIRWVIVGIGAVLSLIGLAGVFGAFGGSRNSRGRREADVART